MSTAELMHFGVKGMHWGVRKEEELSPRKKAHQEALIIKRGKAAQVYQDRADNTQKRLDEFNANRTPDESPQTKKIRDRRARLLAKERDSYQQQADDKRKGGSGLSNSQKKAIFIGTSIVVAYATYKVLDSGTGTQLITRGKSALAGVIGPNWKKNPTLANPNFSPDEVLKNVVSRINPNYGTPGSKMNCRRCTFAYELSRRGYDVKATRSMQGTGQTALGLYNAMHVKEPNGMIDSISKAAKAAKSGNLEDYMTKASEDFVNKLDKIKMFTDGEFPLPTNGRDKAQTILHMLSEQHPKGARGELGMLWDVGGGHSMAWEIFDGKAVIFDNQNGKKYETVDEFAKIASRIQRAGFSRLDNVELNHDFLSKWVQNV